WRRKQLAAILLGMGALVKLYPAVLLLLLPGRRRVMTYGLFGGVIVVGTRAAGGFGRWPLTPIWRYVSDEYFNPGLVRSVVNEPLLALAAAVVWGIVIGWGARGGGLFEEGGA